MTRGEKGKYGNGKGGKEGGKGAVASGCAKMTGDRKAICFAFNARNERCKRGKSCNYAHVCGICFTKGKPMFECCKRG